MSDKKKFNFKVFKRVFALVKPYKGFFVGSLICVILLAVLAPLRPRIIGQMISEFVAGEESILTGLTWSDFAQDNNKSLMFWTSVIILMLVLEAIIQFTQTYMASWLAQSVIKDIRIRLFRHFSGFRLKYFDNTPIGTIVTRTVSDLEALSQVFSEGMIIMSGDLLKIIVVVISMFVYNWQFALISLIPIPLLMIATRLFARAIKKAYQQERVQVNRLNTFVQEHITGMSIVQIFNREKIEMDRFRAINKEHRQAHINAIWAVAIFFPVVELLSSLSIALLIMWGVMMADPEVGNIASLFGKIFAFLLWINMLYRPIRQLADRFNTLQRGMVRAERVFDVLDEQEQIQSEGSIKSAEIKGDINFKNVWFAYKNDDYVLKDLSFEVEKGQTIAFVGATGAGKTSIINLIARFYEFQKGSIAIDDKDIRDYDLSSLRKNIAVVLQDVFLFSDTIYNNITLKDPNISREEVVEAAKKVEVHEFIMSLPGGYDYNVRERGGMLSVGQRQLLSFIRAYVYNPSILILDEATSSVDTESEMLIQKSIDKITENRTSIVIAHRLSTIQKADKIIVLEKGEIVEMGSHFELLELGGHYKTLFDLQFS